MRSLGLNPTTAQLQSLQQSIAAAVAAAAEASGGGAAPTSASNNSSSNYAALEQCESLIATWMLEMKDSLARDDFHVLMRAFQALDPDNRYVHVKCPLCASARPPAYAEAAQWATVAGCSSKADASPHVLACALLTIQAIGKFPKWQPLPSNQQQARSAP